MAFLQPAAAANLSSTAEWLNTAASPPAEQQQQPQLALPQQAAQPELVQPQQPPPQPIQPAVQRQGVPVLRMPAQNFGGQQQLSPTF